MRISSGSRLEAWSAAYRRCLSLLTGERFAVPQEALFYRCRLTASRRRNLALQLLDHPSLRYRVPALPHILHVGVTTFCNLSCPACPTGTGALGRPRQHLDFDIYRRAIDELGEVLMLVPFWDWGEPLLHPRLAEMVEYAGRSGIMTVISTNGSLAAKERIESLVAAAPNVVIVCVDGADQETYERYRVGGRLNKVLETARSLVEIRDRMHSPYPVVEFRTLATRDTERQLPELLGMAENCGADLFSVKSLRPYNYRGANIDSEFVPLARELSRYTYADQPAPEQRLALAGPLTCAKPHRSPTLNSDGDLVFCSYAVHPWERLGNIRDNGFRRVWKSTPARENRLRFSAMGGSESCVECYFRTDHKPTVIHQVPLRPLPPDVMPQSPETREEFLQAIATSTPSAC
jgi:radical SAM protein with 4Fe4S-binding SPASM domain